MRIKPHGGAQRAKESTVTNDKNQRRQSQGPVDSAHSPGPQRYKTFPAFRGKLFTDPLSEPLSHRLPFLRAIRHLLQVIVDNDREPKCLCRNLGRYARAGWAKQ